MKRVEYIDGKLQKEKFVLRNEYGGFGIYQRMTASGYLVSQEWLLVDGKTGIKLQVPSFNYICKEELLDMVDHFNEYGKFGQSGLFRGGNLYMIDIFGYKKI